jgi:hypothetical protein
MPSPSQPPETTGAVAAYVLTHPWDVFVLRWNWKAAVLSSLFRGGAFTLALARVADGDVLRTVLVEALFRVAVGGFWGSLLQEFRRAQPRWLAGIWVAIVLPATAHALEFVALTGIHAGPRRTGMIVSIAISAGSLLINLGLMRRGLFVTGDGGESLVSDLRRIPSALADMVCGLVRIA